MTKALYVGSFDPVTYGHIDLIKRSAKIFDEVVVGIGINTSKKPIFTEQERVNFINHAVRLDNLKVVTFSGLTANFFIENNFDVLIRGVRNGADLEAEKAISGMNNYLNNKIETVFLPTNPKFEFVSSSLIKEVVKMGGSVQGLLPDEIISGLRARLE
ncbi:pantetheine-phosphate adenylyltransferase [Pediococcus claussenii]|uniref:Phosphopantetheine adenylyltransferase n=1 Tax=Pediococcus claussenii (strain ATCC BAA-344 / DSM 14800 / JCM 18046 / KCTC 3811 / LMG 21948 / P06) TaxID=701521 RepID=G8PCX9_PEDCP|nr:pantetheine-phosphate adenylyltransferase [Pediococcus claussenii]AEV95114.1 pantetheine-phosphate adenylyltransferase [Pediococcus claussenii ATCC BAA-344]ANZ70300.1 pantetheine-phosphate adenylyltransferase [Pediococcus claussenii]ANZ72116.1 pantetheine-phosphate adenylyltransferase [Pediococcus claussenii]KRN18873.1 coaD protein [Pediococcus claussenii]